MSSTPIESDTGTRFRPNIEPGDWVRFYQNGRLTLAVVAYVLQDTVFPERWMVYTDCGTVSPNAILENRRNSEYQIVI